MFMCFTFISLVIFSNKIDLIEATHFIILIIKCYITKKFS